MEKVYAEALDRAASRGEDEKRLADGLIAHLKSVGRLKLLPGILAELHARRAHTEKLLPVLEIANKDRKDVAVAEAKALGLTPAHVHVNETLVSGWRVRSGSSLTDRSGKQALIDIYKNIVTK